MTVGELKEILKNISDDVEISIEYRDNDMCQDAVSGVNSWYMDVRHKELILSEFYN